jgi:hypothetical protein
LDEALLHIQRLPPSAAASNALQDHGELALLLEDCLAFSRDGVGEFREWCDRRGHRHRWQTAIYYSEK